MTSIPERIAEEARACLTGCVIAFNNQSDAEKLVSGIAAALLAAEQRGREMERERCIAIITRPLGEGCHAGGLGTRSRSEQGKDE